MAELSEMWARQRLVGGVGDAGQGRLGAARVVVVGLGALGSVAAELLARAGVGLGEGGRLLLVDRDVVEVSNLQRQTLYSWGDVGTPKAAAAAGRIGAILGREVPVVGGDSVEVGSTGVVAVVGEASGERLVEWTESAQCPVPGAQGVLGAGCLSGEWGSAECGVPVQRWCSVPRAGGRSGAGGMCVMVDASDNASIRYVMNDVSVKGGVPWVYGGAVGSEGRVGGFWPGGPGGCLRCVFRDPPGVGEGGTCETVGVLNTVTAMVAAMQVQAVVRMVVEEGWRPGGVGVVEGWSGGGTAWGGRYREIGVERDPACPCCGVGEGGGRFEFLEGERRGGEVVSLCGRETVQVLPPRGARVDLEEIARRWAGMGMEGVGVTRFLVRGVYRGVGLTLFGDGRLLLQGMKEVEGARGWYDRVVGS